MSDLSDGIVVTTEAQFDELIYRPLLEHIKHGQELHAGWASLDSETTKIDPARGFNPFYGTRPAMGSFSWNSVDGTEHNFAFTTRMKPGLLTKPEIPADTPAGEKRERKAVLKEAYQFWIENGDVAELLKLEWLELNVEPVENLTTEFYIGRLNDLTAAGLIWVFKNMKFDLLMYEADGADTIPIEQVHDVEVQSHISEDNPWQQGKKVSHKLQDLAERHLGRMPEGADALGEWFKAMRVADANKDYSAVPVSILGPYAWQDTRDTADLFIFFLRKIADKDESMVKAKRPTLQGIYEADILLIRNLVSKTITDGCAVDQAKADEGYAKHDAIRMLHEKQLFELTGGRTVEWGSPKELGNFLFNSEAEGGLGYKVPEFAITDSGERSVSKGVLEDLDTDLTHEILKWRQAETFCNSFLKPIARFNIDGFIHPDFWLTTVRTGRMSASHPNMQNRPKDSDIRAIFVPRPGYVMVLMDFDQIEMRIAAHYAYRIVQTMPELWVPKVWQGVQNGHFKSTCYDAPLHTGFNSDPEYDPHMTMVERSGLPRRKPKDGVGVYTAKEANFSILYGSGIKGLCRQAGWEYAFAKKVKSDWKKSYPEINHLSNYVVKRLFDQGWIANEFGRRYYVDRGYLGLNYLIQGCAGDLMKRALNRVYALMLLMEQEYEGDTPMRILNVVHDEVIMEVREDLMNPQFARRINNELTTWERGGKPLFTVPITAGCEIAERDWGHAVDYEMAA